MRIRIRVRTSPTEAYEWEHAGPLFRIGRNDDCQLVFHGDRIVSGNHAEIELSPAGAMLSDLRSANGTLLNGAPLTGSFRLAVGDEVRLGQAGPRLDVLAIDLVPAPARISRATGAPPALHAEARAAMAHGALPPLAANAASGTQLPLVETRRQNQRSLALFGVLGLVAILISTGIVWKHVTTTALPAHGLPSTVTPAVPDPLASHPRAAPAQPKATESEPIETKPPAATPPPPTLDPWKDAKERALAAYRLIVVEDPETQRAWPHGGSIVVGEHALLTTAGVAVDLQTTFRDRKWLVSIMKPPHGARVPIAAIRVHALFAQAEPDEQLFFDLALLYVDEPLTDAVALAAPGDLGQLEHGQPLRCIAIDHDVDALNRFDPLTPENYALEIFSVTRFPDPELPGGPWLLRLKSALGARVLGSPIVDERGHVVALYCGAAEEVNAKGGPELSFAKVIEPGMIRDALERRDDPQWVAPVAPPPTNPVGK